MLSSLNGCLNHCQGLRCIFSKICIKCNAHLLSDLLQNRIRPDTGLKINRCKKSACTSSCMEFCTLTPKIS
jgi:hypothetical protein